ncbi:MAG TPA: GvpL/GvpF family gas vesicle protein [Solirubrobacteraceae bacterium]|jgi:hypothetical protein|nr:GvpL/GvpF family gas vesicle protein [Solirubrobacteraceae bacterium]
MTLLLYAVTDRQAVSGSGIGGAPLSLVRSAGLAAVVSGSQMPAPEATEEKIWEYERVVESLMDASTILPVRFGTTLEHEDDAGEFLARHRDGLSQGLDRVRGTVEMGVRVQWRAGVDAPLEEPSDSGTAYMLARLTLLRSARGIAERLAPLLSMARLGKVAVMPRRGVAVLAAYLVDRGRADQFAAWCDRLHDGLEQAQLACTGPWPPYSFVTEDTGR